MNKESSAGFAIGTSDELLIKENALERFGPKWGEPEDRERAVQGGWIDAEGEITTKGWDLLNEDINRIEKNSVSWLDKKFHGARSEGHGDYELVGTFWFDPHNPEQANLVYLAANNGAQERIDMVDWSYGDFTTAFDGVSWFGGLVLDGSITFFDVKPEDMEIIDATLERERKKTKTRRTRTREEVQRIPSSRRPSRDWVQTHAIIGVPGDPIQVRAEAGHAGGLVLYTRIEWESDSAADWEQQPDGTITFQGRTTSGRLIKGSTESWSFETSLSPAEDAMRTRRTRRPPMMRERMFIVTTAHDITTYLRNFRGDIAIAGSDIWKRATEALRAADHPPWGTDWKEWLDLPSTQRMIDDVARKTSPRARTSMREPQLAQRFQVGDRVQMSDDALANYGERWRGVALVITHVSTAYMPSSEFFSRGKPQGYHPGYDPESDSALYDFDVEDTGRPGSMSLYDWELEPAEARRRRAREIPYPAARPIRALPSRRR